MRPNSGKKKSEGRMGKKKRDSKRVVTNPVQSDFEIFFNQTDKHRF